MADQKRWFKVWTSILEDPHFQELSLEDIGRWTLLGALMARVGTRGALRVPRAARRLRELLGVDVTVNVPLLLARLPNIAVSDGVVKWLHGLNKRPKFVGSAWLHGAPLDEAQMAGCGSFKEWCARHGEFVVTFKNWHKYQEDTTMASRGRASRSRHVTEKLLGSPPMVPPQTPPPSSPSQLPREEEKSREEEGRPIFHVPASVLEALTKSPTLGAAPRLRTPAYWQAEVRANPGVDFAREVLKAEAWMQANPTKAPKRDFPRFLHTWLARADRETEDGD